MNNEEYKYGFNDGDISIIKFSKGLDENKIRKISELKKEPKWLLDYRLDSYQKFLKLENPNFGPSLEDINFNDIHYFVKASDKTSDQWEKVPTKIKNTFNMNQK